MGNKKNSPELICPSYWLLCYNADHSQGVVEVLVVGITRQTLEANLRTSTI